LFNISKIGKGVDGESSKQMKTKTLELHFNGKLLQRGFWFYVGRFYEMEREKE